MSYLDEIPKELLEEICLLLPVDDIRNINSMDLLFKIGLDEVFWIRYYRNRQYSFIRRYQNLFDFYSSHKSTNPTTTERLLSVSTGKFRLKKQICVQLISLVTDPKASLADDPVSVCLQK